MNGNFTLPFIIGLSSGIGLMYLLNTRQKSSGRAYLGNLDTEAYRSDYLNATNQENFGKYVDAEQEVEKRQHDLENRVQTLRTGSNLPLGERVVSIDREDETIVSNNKGRSVNQS
jgi:hypothetical protein